MERQALDGAGAARRTNRVRRDRSPVAEGPEGCFRRSTGDAARRICRRCRRTSAPRAAPARAAARTAPAAAAGRLHDVVDIAKDLCAALDYIHGLGLVHRDVKPANVFLGGDGRVTLLDFGLVCPARGVSGSYAAARFCVGTMEYAAPEQIRGEPVDARADIYSLGCVLYELVTGRRHVDGDRPHRRRRATGARRSRRRAGAVCRATEGYGRELAIAGEPSRRASRRSSHRRPRRASAGEPESDDDGADREQRRRDDHDRVAELVRLLPVLLDPDAHRRTAPRWPVPSAASWPATAGWSSAHGHAADASVRAGGGRYARGAWFDVRVPVVRDAEAGARVRRNAVRRDAAGGRAARERTAARRSLRVARAMARTDRTAAASRGRSGSDRRRTGGTPSRGCCSPARH